MKPTLFSFLYKRFGLILMFPDFATGAVFKDCFLGFGGTLVIVLKLVPWSTDATGADCIKGC